MERELGPPQWTARLPLGAGWMDANLTQTSAKAIVVVVLKESLVSSRNISHSDNMAR